MKVHLCEGCAGGAGWAGALAAAIKAAGIAAQVQTVACMSGCARPATAAFRDHGKVAYLFGDLGAADIGALVVFAGLYAASVDGVFADARPLGSLRFKALARIPA